MNSIYFYDFYFIRDIFLFLPQYILVITLVLSQSYERKRDKLKFSFLCYNSLFFPEYSYISFFSKLCWRKYWFYFLKTTTYYLFTCIFLHQNYIKLNMYVMKVSTNLGFFSLILCNWEILYLSYVFENRAYRIRCTNLEAI